MMPFMFTISISSRVPFISLDIRAVLKDLQMLSTTLLSMEASEPDPGIGTVTGSRTGNQ